MVAKAGRHGGSSTEYQELISLISNR